MLRFTLQDFVKGFKYTHTPVVEVQRFLGGHRHLAVLDMIFG